MGDLGRGDLVPAGGWPRWVKSWVTFVAIKVGGIRLRARPFCYFCSFLEAYEVVDRPRLYRMARKSKRGVAPKRVS